MFELSTSYLKASWWMVDSCMARIGEREREGEALTKNPPKNISFHNKKISFHIGVFRVHISFHIGVFRGPISFHIGVFRGPMVDILIAEKSIETLSHQPPNA